MTNVYDPLIKGLTEKLWPGLDWQIIKCQIEQESCFNPEAVSPCGAMGLLQLMYATAAELGVMQPKQLFDPETNLSAGIKYLKIQYNHFGEIPDHEERVKFALASYNGGRGYINKAIEVGKRENPCIDWIFWDIVKEYLGHADCQVNGKHPDHKQITDYVKRIWGSYIIEKEKA
jgi:membrane-bound lytic murein transglycosylase MltF